MEMLISLILFVGVVYFLVKRRKKSQGTGGSFEQEKPGKDKVN